MEFYSLVLFFRVCSVFTFTIMSSVNENQSAAPSIEVSEGGERRSEPRLDVPDGEVQADPVSSQSGSLERPVNINFSLNFPNWELIWRDPC